MAPTLWSMKTLHAIRALFHEFYFSSWLKGDFRYIYIGLLILRTRKLKHGEGSVFCQVTQRVSGRGGERLVLVEDHRLTPYWRLCSTRGLASHRDAYKMLLLCNEWTTLWVQQSIMEHVHCKDANRVMLSATQWHHLTCGLEGSPVLKQVLAQAALSSWNLKTRTWQVPKMFIEETPGRHIADS